MSRRSFKSFILMVLVLFVAFVPSFAVMSQTRTYTVQKVVDGDTLDISDGQVTFRVRILGMDAPEKAQSFGLSAKEFMKTHVEGKPVGLTQEKQKIDRYGRSLAHVTAQNENLAVTLIKQGLATYYRPTCEDYPKGIAKLDYDALPFVNAEQLARQAKKGVWSSPEFILPCQFRKLNKKH